MNDPELTLTRALSLICLSVIGGFITALVCAASIDHEAGLRALILPAVAEIALVIGGIAGLLISPLMVWSLKDKNLWIAVPCIYGLACIAVVILNLLSAGHPARIAFGITVVGLFVYGLCGKR
jgi:hypothetical protein